MRGSEVHGAECGAGPDLVSLAFRGLATGIAAGVAVVTFSLWLVRTLQRSAPAAGASPDLDSPEAFVLLIGSLGGVLLAAIVTWRLLAPIGSAYRQGGLGLVAGFATILVVTLIALPMDQVAGRWGVLGVSLVAGLAARRLARAATRAQGRA